MLHLQAGHDRLRGLCKVCPYILYTDHVNDHVCSRFHEKMENARTRTCKPEIAVADFEGGGGGGGRATGETYQTCKLPKPDHCLVNYLQG